MVKESSNGWVIIAPKATSVHVHRVALSPLWILLIIYAAIGAATKANNSECVGHLWKNIACIGSLYNHGQTNTSKSGIVPRTIPRRYAFFQSFFHPISQATAHPNTPCDMLSMLVL